MKKFAPIIAVLILCLLSGCREDSQFNVWLDEMDSLMQTRPDSAYILLQERADSITHLPKSQQMHYFLLSAKAQNKAYVDFTTDSLMLTVTEYYDQHGNPNERMMAHYLLGCCYRDMGEAPRTIECYKEALACADTLSNDCDYRTMMSISGQMATLYDKQVMPEEELEALEMSEWCALKCKDTLSYIRSIQLKVQPFNLMHDTSRIFEVTNLAVNLYRTHGFIREAAQALPVAIYKKLEAEKYDDARSLMHIYETQSGRFDEYGNINPRYSHYYDSKGKYYLGIHKLDSAELFFRKLLAAGFMFDATRGLSKVYKERKEADSAIYYSILSEDALDKEFSEISKQSVRQTEAMYDYTRNQRIAYENRLKAERIHIKAFYAIVILLCILVASILYHKKQKERREKRIKEMMQDYLNLNTLYEKSLEDAVLARHSLFDFEQSKQKEIEELKTSLEIMYPSLNEIGKKERLRALMESKIVVAFKNMAIPRLKKKVPSEKQWKELSNAIQKTFPSFYNSISAKNLLSCQEYRITILILLGFTVGEVSVLLCTGSQRITNAKRSANYKLYKVDNAHSFAANIRKFSF